MDNRYYENVIGEMQSFLDEHNFKSEENGTFSNGAKRFLVSYIEEKQSYTLSVADIDEEGNASDYKEINAWLFDDSQNAKDAAAVGIDFVNSMRKEIGVKIKRAVNNAVELPSASKSGAMTVTGFTKKMLDVFPVLKDDYKEHVSAFGDFLYMNFFGEKLVPQIKSVLRENNKKSVKKLFDVFENGYLQGDRDTVNVIVAVIAAACANDDTVKANAIAALGDNKHFIDSLTQFIPVVASNKKLSAALLK